MTGLVRAVFHPDLAAAVKKMEEASSSTNNGGGGGQQQVPAFLNQLALVEVAQRHAK